MTEKELSVSESEIQSLLNEVRHIKEKSDAVLEATGENYNFFRVLCIDHDELIFSRMIASLLEPNGSHGFKGRFLQLFIKSLPVDKKDLPTDFDFENAKVEVEKDIGSRNDKEESGGRIDIFITIPSKTQGIFAFIIENKIYADDQNKQLLRYRKYANQQYPNKNFILYLTLNGRNPSEESVDKENLDKEENQFWINITYKKDIRDWIENCSMEAVQFPLLRETLTSFNNQIKRLTGQDGTKMAQKELIDLLSKDENIEATKKINAIYADVEKERANRLISRIEENCSKYQLNRVKLNNKIGEKDYCIQYQGKKWSKVMIGFAFWYPDLREFKCTISYVDAFMENKDILIHKLAGLITIKDKDIEGHISNSEKSPWRMVYSNHSWVGKESKILNAVPIIIEILNVMAEKKEI